MRTPIEALIASLAKPKVGTLRHVNIGQKQWISLTRASEGTKVIGPPHRAERRSFSSTMRVIDTFCLQSQLGFMKQERSRIPQAGDLPRIKSRPLLTFQAALFPMQSAEFRPSSPRVGLRVLRPI